MRSRISELAQFEQIFKLLDERLQIDQISHFMLSKTKSIANALERLESGHEPLTIVYRRRKRGKKKVLFK